jgi:hypothetical protein
MARAAASKNADLTAAEALAAELGDLTDEVETGIAIEEDAAELGTSVSTIDGAEYTIIRGDKEMHPCRYLPKSLWGSVRELDDRIIESVNAAETDKGNIVEDVLMTTGQRRFDRLFGLMTPTNPNSEPRGFSVKKDTAARSVVLVYTNTDPAVPLSGDLKVVSLLSVSTPAEGDRVFVDAAYLKNRIVLSPDGKQMTVLAGARTSVSWGKTKEEQVYLNVSAAAQCAKRPVGSLVGRERQVLAIAKRLSWLHSMVKEHGTGAMKREAHLLAFAGLRNVYFGVPKGADNANPSLHASFAFVIDPKTRAEVGATSYLWSQADFNLA